MSHFITSNDSHPFEIVKTRVINVDKSSASHLPAFVKTVNQINSLERKCIPDKVRYMSLRYVLMGLMG